MAHQLLHSIYRDILGQQQHAESVPRAMERDGFLCFMVLHFVVESTVCALFDNRDGILLSGGTGKIVMPIVRKTPSSSHRRPPTRFRTRCM